jgi:hypothetical protein
VVQTPTLRPACSSGFHILQNHQHEEHSQGKHHGDGDSCTEGAVWAEWDPLCRICHRACAPDKGENRNGEKEHLPGYVLRFKHSWEAFIDSLLRAWKTLNVVSALLLSYFFFASRSSRSGRTYELDAVPYLLCFRFRVQETAMSGSSSRVGSIPTV